MTEIEYRLRADLPRLAELIARRPDEELPMLVSRLELPRGRRRVRATVVAMLCARGRRHRLGARRRQAHEATPGRRESSSAISGEPCRRRRSDHAGARSRCGPGTTFSYGEAIEERDSAARSPERRRLQPGDELVAEDRRQPVGAPRAHGVWAEDRLFVLAKNGGAQYDPATNAWHDIASLPDGTEGGFLAASWSGTTLFGVLADGRVGVIAVARFDERRDAWTIGRSVHASAPCHRHAYRQCGPGRSSQCRTAPAPCGPTIPRGTRGGLTNLAQGATSSSIASIGGKLEAVYLAHDVLHAARAVGNRVAHDRYFAAHADITTDRH